MGNEYDYKCKGFELKAVSKSEFDALKRFGDYNELQDGTLMRAEGDKEFRIYCEDVQGCPIGIVTQGVLNLFEDLYDEGDPREADDVSDQRERHFGQCDSVPRNKVRNRAGLQRPVA
jgi:hypothetical protein